MNYINEVVKSKVPDLVEIPFNMSCVSVEVLMISFGGFRPLEFTFQNQNLNLILQMCCDCLNKIISSFKETHVFADAHLFWREDGQMGMKISKILKENYEEMMERYKGVE